MTSKGVTGCLVGCHALLRAGVEVGLHTAAPVPVVLLFCLAFELRFLVMCRDGAKVTVAALRCTAQRVPELHVRSADCPA